MNCIGGGKQADRQAGALFIGLLQPKPGQHIFRKCAGSLQESGGRRTEAHPKTLEQADVTTANRGKEGGTESYGEENCR